MEYQIRSDLPLPNDLKSQWPFKRMVIGESARFDSGPLFRKAANAAYAYAFGRKKDGVKFRIKWYPNDSGDEMQGYGIIWRVS